MDVDPSSLRPNSLGTHRCRAYSCTVKKTARKFRSFSEAEKADRDFYKKLTGNERLQILVELLNHGPEQRLERVSRIINSSGVDCSIQHESLGDRRRNPGFHPW